MKKINISVLKNLNCFFVLISLCIVLTTLGCKSVPEEKNNQAVTEYNFSIQNLCPDELISKWETIEPGFEYLSHDLTNLKIKWTCVKVDLDTPGLNLITSVQDKGPQKLISVKNFAETNNAIVAINTTPFENNRYPYNPVGIVKINNKEYFSPVEKYSALCFTEKPLRAYIVQNQTPELLKSFPTAIGGFFQVLKEGKLIEFKKFRNSRIAVGTNKNGNILYLFSVIGHNRNDEFNGLTFEECGEILQKLGCQDVMHFDGGHSSCLIINGKESQKSFPNRKIPIAIGLKK